MGRDSDREALLPLYRAIVSAARLPVWYKAGKVPDTKDGRFDMIAAILSLVLLRLEREGPHTNAPAARLKHSWTIWMGSCGRRAWATSSSASMSAG
jgi:cytochrome b pre-mRNA-processing protein 3